MSHQQKRKLLPGLGLVAVLGIMLITQSCIYGESKECEGIVCDVGMTCSATLHPVCIPEGCGNAKKTDGEECDAGEETKECNINCKRPTCGDNVVNQAAGEECEPGIPGTENCTDDCKWVRHLDLCGDGNLDPGEACDDGNKITETKCYYEQQTCTECNADCSEKLNLTGPYCGDGIINGPRRAEQCDLIDMPELCIVGVNQCKWASPHDKNLSQFKLTKDIVVDSKSNLVWQRKHAGQGYKWKNAVDYCNNLNLAGYDGWRLPTKSELESLVDASQSVKPYINKDAFPDTPSTWYWTSTGKADDPGFALAVSFSDGHTERGDKSYYNYVRCVR